MLLKFTHNSLTPPQNQDSVECLKKGNLSDEQTHLLKTVRMVLESPQVQEELAITLPSPAIFFKDELCVYKIEINPLPVYLS